MLGAVEDSTKQLSTKDRFPSPSTHVTCPMRAHRYSSQGHQGGRLSEFICSRMTPIASTLWVMQGVSVAAYPSRDRREARWTAPRGPAPPRSRPFRLSRGLP